MKCLHIQLHPQRCSVDTENHVNRLSEIATDSVLDVIVDVERGDDDVPYINVNIYTDEMVSLWSAVCFEIESKPSLASATIVCCEGENGWDDYFLLHHFDGDEAVDTLP